MTTLPGTPDRFRRIDSTRRSRFAVVAQQPLEMILVRQLASYLAVPIWVTDDTGNLIFYNEPAENLVGASFEEVGPINADRLADMFKTTDLEGNPVETSGLALARALNSRSPAHGTIRFSGVDDVSHDIEVVAVPITGQGDRFLGVMVTFWEVGG